MDFIKLFKRGYIVLITIDVFLDFNGIQSSVTLDQQVDLVAVPVTEARMPRVYCREDSVLVRPEPFPAS